MSCLITSWVIEMTSILLKENSVKPNIKADGTGSLRGRRREGGIWSREAREAREVSRLNSLPLSTATQPTGSGPVY